MINLMRLRLLAICLGLLLLVAGVRSAVPPPPICSKKVVKVGDGSPHPSCRILQVSGTNNCTSGTCSVEHSVSKTVGWELALQGSGTYAALGFAVSESYTTGNAYSCDGAENQLTCVHALVTYTDYTAKEEHVGGLCPILHATPYVIYAPTKAGQGNFACARNADCHAMGWEQWNHDGKACPG
jgi:hypothetical protein